MQQTLLDRQQLAERWGVTVRTIIKYEQQGIMEELKSMNSLKIVIL